MKKQLRNTALFLLGLAVAQQGVSRISAALFYRQQEIVIQKEIDPSVFFYTESKHALKAEKKLREKTGSME